MKYKLFVIILFCITSNAFSQTAKKLKPNKIETEQWIKEKLNSYPYNNYKGISNNYSINFENNNMLIVNDSRVQGEILVDKTKIKILDIDYISIINKENNVWLVIMLKSNKFEETTFNDELINANGKYEFILSKDFNNNDLPERMKKAFNRLLELYGGNSNANKETY